MFINTLPVRFDVDGQSVRAGVLAAHARLAGLMRHEHASLALAQRCSGLAAPAPLFSSLFNFRHSASEIVADTIWDGMEVLSGDERTNYPLTMSVADFGTGFHLTAQASAEIDAARICAYLHTALEHLVTALEGAPATALRTLDVLPAAEREQILVTWNDTQRDYPQDAAIHTLFERQVEATPEAIAVAFEEQTVTYAALNAQANRLAHHLRSIGVAEGDFVGIALDRSIALVVAQLAVLKAGGAYVPLDAVLPLPRQELMLSDCGVKLVLGTAGRSVPDSVALVDVDDTCIGNRADNPPTTTTGTSVAYVMYTSGSSGTPKGVAVPHRAISRLVINNGYLACEASDRVAFAANPAFDASTMEVWGPLLNGGGLVVIDQATLLEPSRFVGALAEQGVNVMWLTVGLFNQYATALAGYLPQLR
jgi:non-ribosomal peptide synthetase component F